MLTRTGGTLVPALTSFVGREEELAHLRARIAEHRLVTLTGEGGSGKTRLAAALCGELLDSVDHTWWVDLGSVTDAALVTSTVADTLGVRVEPEADPVSRLVRDLRSREVVLCLDTCEHVLDDVAELAHRLLVGCERLVVLATSREPLGVPGEAVYRVPRLTPGDASRLFADRAALSDPEFSVDGVEADVAAICARADGLPLAVELAASWVHALTPAQIASGLADSLQLLGGGPRTAIPRHRAMVASIDWSYDLLDPHEQRVLRRLGVFVGDFTAAAAVAVAGESPADPSAQTAAPGLVEDPDDVLVVTRRLVDKSLIVTRRHGDHVRYRLLDTVRHYALDKLRRSGEVPSTRDRHLRHYLDLAARARAGFAHDQDRGRAVLDAERDNLHAALDWALTPARASTGRRLAAVLAQHWAVRSHAREGVRFLRRALDLDPTDRSALQAELLVSSAWLAMVSGRVPQVGEAAAAAEQIAVENDDTVVAAQALAMSAYSVYFLDPPRCRDLARRASAMAAAAGDVFTQDWSATLDAYTFNRQDRHAEAVAVAEPALARATARNDRFCGSFLLGVDMLARLNTGDVRGAVAVAEEVMSLAEPLGDYFAYGSNATNVALAHGMAGSLDRGRAIMASIVEDLGRSSDVDVIAHVFVIGTLHLWSGHPAEALPWFERGIEQHDTYEWTATRCLVPLATTLRRLGRVEEAAHMAERAATAAAAVDGPFVVAAAWDEQARLAAATDPARAFDLHHRALALRREVGLHTYLPDSLDALAGLAAHSGSLLSAARMLAAGESARERIGYPRPPVDRSDHDRLVALVQRELGDGAFHDAWAEGSRLSLDQAVADVTRGRGPRDRPTSGWSSLSPTELSVAAMVADGLPNPEIARRLFISRGTVKSHLSHIYAKLGTSSRTELAAIATARRGDDLR